MTDHSTSINYYYLADGLGSITEIQDEDQNTIEKYRYDSFGNPTILAAGGTELTESAIGNSYMFTAREWDTETGLYYYRNRFYIPEVGRFLNEDPIGFEGGLNLYLYVGNNPLSYIDPFGFGRKKVSRRTIWTDKIYDRTVYICEDPDGKCKTCPEQAKPHWSALSPYEVPKLYRTQELEKIETWEKSIKDAIGGILTGLPVPDTYDFSINVISDIYHNPSPQWDSYFECTCATLGSQRIEEKPAHRFKDRQTDWRIVKEENWL